ncbi:MAG: translation elongation factor Ts [Lentimicrobiaceae bacterium]|nr:translation elongation factor Ts [Lentimicrobiaceae bacterium]
MANITAAQVNELRKITGAGMMDCKKALVESNGDIEAAIDILRKKGQKVAVNRADRDANQGIVIARTTADNGFASVIMLNCETDFVAKNQDFIDFANKISDATIEHQPKSLDELLQIKIDGFTVEEGVTHLIGKTGEKMQLAHYEHITAPYTAAYNHFDNRLSAIVGFNKKDVNDIEQIGNDISMQVAAMNPLAVDKDSIPQSAIDREIEIGKEQARAEGKPEEMLEKIAMGKLNRFFKENTLLEQEFINEAKVSVKDYLQRIDKNFTVTDLKRFQLGS